MSQMPWRRIEMVTHLSPDDVHDRLVRLVRRRRTFWEAVTRSRSPGPKAQPFVGELTADRFQINRDIRYGNSFLPVIRGRICANPSGGTVLKMTMSLPIFTAGFMALWFSGVLFAVVVAIRQAIAGGAVVLVPFGLIAAGVAMVAIGFYPEARKAERLIRSVLQ
jgi:hypothetical protein